MSDASAAHRLRATVEYDGTAFHGSQLQPGVRTVQGEVEAGLSRLLDRDVRIDLAGRTDAGVHATAQEIAFDAPSRWTPAELSRALRAVLPDDIGVWKVERASDGFHPRFDASARRYEYLLAGGSLAGSPFLRSRTWRLGELPELERLASLTADLPGERSFSGFAKSGQPERGTRCRVESAVWRTIGPGLLAFRIVADRFLHHMVRYLVGTTVEAASGRREETDVAAALADGAPSRPVFPAPAEGLYLSGVRYPEGWNRDEGVAWLESR